MDNKKIGNKDYVDAPQLKDLAADIIEKEKLNMYGANIGYVLVYPNVSKTIAGQCTRANKDLKYYSDCDYVIKMSGELWDSLSDESQYILMFHELLHILPVTNDKTGDVSYKLRDHDVKDFAILINRHGIKWLETVHAINCSLNDTDVNDPKNKLTL
jgi:predicted metallopeptidase